MPQVMFQEAQGLVALSALIAELSETAMPQVMFQEAQRLAALSA